MLSPLKPLLCRHEFYWSERHRADRCRRCGKTQAADAGDAFGSFEAAPNGSSRVEGDRVSFASAGRAESMDDAFFDIPAIDEVTPALPRRRPPSVKVLKAQTQERRERLLALLDRLAEGGQPSRQDSLDAVLGVIEDAHSADPVLFGPDAVTHFARLHEARRDLIS